MGAPFNKLQINLALGSFLNGCSFNQSKDSIALHKYCNLIASYKEKYQELIKEEKYEWILQELVKIINPPFSRSKYKVKLT
jgi:hypothetical protein